MNDLIQKAKEVIEQVTYITLATVTPDGKPWNSPVYAPHDARYTFYWASWTENQHSKNIDTNENVFIVIYDSTVPEGTGFGVYIQAKAYQISDEKELEELLPAYYHSKNKNPRLLKEFQGEYPRRFYKAIPEKVWVNADGQLNGNFVDTRVEISLT